MGSEVVDHSTGRFTVAGKRPNGQAPLYFDSTHRVWVAPWRRPDGKVGKPTGRTRALVEASSDPHIEAAKNDALLARLNPDDEDIVFALRYVSGCQGTYTAA